MRLESKLLDGIPNFLDSVDLKWDKIAFLHTEVMTDHMIVNNSAEEITLSGFIDFEPSMWGASEYDLAAVGPFVAEGDKAILKSFMSGYDVKADAEFHRRIMAYLILHKYSNLTWYLKFMPDGNSIEDLADKWFKVN